MARVRNVLACLSGRQQQKQCNAGLTLSASFKKNTAQEYQLPDRQLLLEPLLELQLQSAESPQI